MPKIRDGALTPKQRAFVEIFVKENGRLTATECRKEVVTASLDNMTRPELEAKLKEIRDHNVINGEAIGVEIKDITEIEDDTTI